MKAWYEEGDSNPHALRTPDPKSGASTNSAILAIKRKSINLLTLHRRCKLVSGKEHRFVHFKIFQNFSRAFGHAKQGIRRPADRQVDLVS